VSTFWLVQKESPLEDYNIAMLRRSTRYDRRVIDEREGYIYSLRLMWPPPTLQTKSHGSNLCKKAIRTIRKYYYTCSYLLSLMEIRYDDS